MPAVSVAYRSDRRRKKLLNKEKVIRRLLFLSKKTLAVFGKKDCGETFYNRNVCKQMIYKKKNKWNKLKKVDWNTLFLRIFANGSVTL